MRRAGSASAAATKRAWPIVLVAFAGCFLPLHGRVRSAHPLAGEHAPAIVRAAACGRVREARPSPLARAPYVQAVTDTGATLRWSSRSREPEHVVLRVGDTSWQLASRPATDDRGPRFERLARATELEPGSRGCYELRGAHGELVYGPVAFHTAPSGGSDGPVAAIVFGDSGGGGPDQRAVRDRMLELPVDLLLHAGDLAYPAASTARLDEVVFDVYEALLRSTPLYPAIGNHDIRHDGGASHLAAFDLPEEPGGERFYSLDWGPLHVAVLDTNGDLRAQAAWLDRDLAASDAPFEIVVGHHPPFSSGWHGGSPSVREHVVPVLLRRGVRLAIAGHDHHYERTHEIDGVTYVVTGGGGHSVRDLRPAPHARVSEAVLHFVHLRVTAWRLEVRAVDATGAVFDSFAIDR